MAECDGVSLNCMLDSGATHSFVHPRVVKSTGASPSEGAVLTVMVANGNKQLCTDVCELNLKVSAEGGDRQVVVKS